MSVITDPMAAMVAVMACEAIFLIPAALIIGRGRGFITAGNILCHSLHAIINGIVIIVLMIESGGPKNRETLRLSGDRVSLASIASDLIVALGVPGLLVMNLGEMAIVNKD